MNVQELPLTESDEKRFLDNYFDSSLTKNEQNRRR
jgi:hypothetical protein